MDTLEYFKLPRGHREDLYCHEAYKELRSIDVDDLAGDDTLTGLVEHLVDACLAKLEFEMDPPNDPRFGVQHPVRRALGWNYVSCLVDVRREIEYRRDMELAAKESETRAVLRSWS